MSYVIVSSKKKGSAVVELKSVASAVSIQSHEINGFLHIVQTENNLLQMSYCCYKDNCNLMDNIRIRCPIHGC